MKKLIAALLATAAVCNDELVGTLVLLLTCAAFLSWIFRGVERSEWK